MERYTMARWGRIESQATNTFNRALARKGYLSLCSIVESQYYIPRTYSMNLMKNTHVAVVNRPENKELLPQQYNIVKYRIEYQQKRNRKQEVLRNRESSKIKPLIFFSNVDDKSV